MNILVVGGTRFMGKHLVSELISKGHNITIATRGISQDEFSNSVRRLKIDRLNEGSLKKNLSNQYFDIVYDSLAYCSNNVKSLLNNINCAKYVMISTTAVYDKHIDTKEDEFNPISKKLIWCDRNDFSYDETKKQAECAIVQEYTHIPSVRVRFPVVIGQDDYTKRLYFYVEHIVNQIPMYVDNYDKQMAFINSNEAGRFLACFAKNNYIGAINGANTGTVSIKDISDYIENKIGKKALLSLNGENSPFNGECEFSINIKKANDLGFNFSPLHTYIYDLIDNYIKELQK